MKKTTLFILCFVLPLLMLAQTKNFTIDWDDAVQKVSSVQQRGSVTKPSKVKYIKPSLNLVLSEKELKYSQQWPDNGFANKNSLKVSNIKYGTLSSQELRRINQDIIPKKLSYSIATSKDRNKLFTQFSISPVINDNGIYKKVLGFTVNYSKNNQSSNIAPRMPITNSVLASGNWYKFKIEKTGVHRITKDFLNDLGMNTNGINPRNLKVYGNGGKPLPLLNINNTEFDLPENAIQVVGEEDGSFDNGDFILFYAEGSRGPIDYLEDENNDIDTNINAYSDDTFYYVTVSGSTGRRVQTMQEPDGQATEVITTFNDYQFFEEDEISPAKVGRKWYSNRFDIEDEQSFEFEFPNIVTGAPMNVYVEAAAASETGTSMAITINETSVDPLTFAALAGQNLLRNDSESVEVPASGETVTVDLTYNNSGNPSSIGYLDFISVEAVRGLIGVDGQLAFQYNLAATLSGVGSYVIDNASQFSQVWDVTNPSIITAKANDGNSGSFSFKTNLGSLRKYVAVNPNDYFDPIEIANSFVPNQNLKGTIFNDASGNFQDIDYLIVTAPFLLQPALRLANHRRSIDGLNIKVVTTDKIYEEFSSGKQDISAIRNFVRYIYENGSSDSQRIKYLCLFGDTSVDYKNRIPNNNNIVPTFHTLTSGNTFSDFMSDDFFVSVDPNEGQVGINDLLDVAVGRILADEVGLANALVDKIVAYDSKRSYGNWRNNFTLISDDVDEHFEYKSLEVNLDNLGDLISQEKPFINVKKIHSDAFQQETSAGGNRYPQVNEEIKNDIEVGALIVNYFGHGGEDGLAKEFIFTKQDAQNLNNKDKYPLVVTVTCEFTKFDLPTRITAGELTYWNRNGGAIALVTTTRSIGVSLGVSFNQILADELFGFGEDVPATPAEALRVSKNDNSISGNNNRRVIFFIGDPAMHLAFPKKDIRLTTLNGVPLAPRFADTLKALSRVRIGGEVVDSNGALQTDYNGILAAKIFDKFVERETLANDGVRDNNTDADNDGDTNNILKLKFTTLGAGLFNGQATVTNGKFEFEFVVPRDIQIPVGNGRVSFYSEKNNELEDNAGYNLDIKVGGINEDAPEDNQGPLIKLFMNDESFVSGGITNDSPILIAKLEDENGINTASGIGHDMIAILDGDEANPFVLNEYYQADVDDFTKGVANYPFRDLAAGLHTLTFKAWDVYNNSSTAEIQFIVFGDDSLEINRVLNYPNPFVDYTEFWFNHNRPFEMLDIQVQVFTITGKVVWTKNVTDMSDGFLYNKITWDGRDDFGDRIGKGVYVYKITVKSTLTNQQVEKFEKLVIL